MSLCCPLCGEPFHDEADWVDRIEVKSRRKNKTISEFHPRCLELLEGVVKAMIRMARFPELSEVLKK